MRRRVSHCSVARSQSSLPISTTSPTDDNDPSMRACIIVAQHTRGAVGVHVADCASQQGLLLDADGRQMLNQSYNVKLTRRGMCAAARAQRHGTLRSARGSRSTRTATCASCISQLQPSEILKDQAMYLDDVFQSIIERTSSILSSVKSTQLDWNNNTCELNTWQCSRTSPRIGAPARTQHTPAP